MLPYKYTTKSITNKSKKIWFLLRLFEKEIKNDRHRPSCAVISFLKMTFPHLHQEATFQTVSYHELLCQINIYNYTPFLLFFDFEKGLLDLRILRGVIGVGPPVGLSPSGGSLPRCCWSCWKGRPDERSSGAGQPRTRTATPEQWRTAGGGHKPRTADAGRTEPEQDERRAQDQDRLSRTGGGKNRRTCGAKFI